MVTSPIAEQDYPCTWEQFIDWFCTEESCLEFLEQLRWPNGFICPECGSKTKPLSGSRKRLICRNCKHQSTVTAGTIFDKTRTPLKTWFAAAWYITSQKQGVSALGLQHILGLSSYETAWTILHRFRRAMVRPDRERLKGHVEIDETYIAITRHNQPKTKFGRKNRKSHTAKTLVAVAVEILEPKGFGRIRLQRIESDAEHHLLPFVLESVEVGSKVRTDGILATGHWKSKVIYTNHTSSQGTLYLHTS